MLQCDDNPRFLLGETYCPLIIFWSKNNKSASRLVFCNCNVVFRCRNDM